MKLFPAFEKYTTIGENIFKTGFYLEKKLWSHYKIMEFLKTILLRNTSICGFIYVKGGGELWG